METDNNIRIVDYKTYCPTCKYKDLSEVADPCNDCLNIPINDGTEKPVKWEEIKK